MSFVCDHCKKHQPTRTKPIRQVVEWKYNTSKVQVNHYSDEDDSDPITSYKEVESKQIKKEADLCAECNAKFTGIPLKTKSELPLPKHSEELLQSINNQSNNISS